jgi:TM2 domain-containing membrane protein YozV
VQGKVGWGLTIALSVFSLTGAIILLGIFAIATFGIAVWRLWFKVDEIATVTTPLTSAVYELKDRVEILETKIKEE